MKSFILLLLPAAAAALLGAAAFDKAAMKAEVVSMFRHAFDSYMRYAWPADELMPLSCKGRVRGVTPSRGDVDDSLGNFSLTLIDSLDTLVVLGLYDEFELGVTRVIAGVRFDSDLVVSVFETNIRVLGGLLGAHMMAKALQAAQPQRMPWYSDQLLRMAHDCGTRLLPAFNTTTGMPFPRINLKYGMIGQLRTQKDTCTACAGTMVLEFAALSRLTGDPSFEAKAHKAMDFLWQQRHRGSDLMGTVLNVMNGDWVRRDSGIGAGIDSYYEYCLKAYILLGDKAYLHRFNRHYDAVMKYVNQGPLFVDVHMHKPTVASRNFMDSLLAFWPGLQVLSGDIKPAIEIHEMLYQVVQKHRFLPEAFTHDFQVHWGQYPLRPEFVESTYFLYRATKDPHYLEVGAAAIEAMNKHVRVPCGFAGVKDVRTMAHEDRMDSFLLAETFKYLYLLFAEPGDLVFDPESYVFTTEAHFLPLSIASAPFGPASAVPGSLYTPPAHKSEDERSCVNTRMEFRGEMSAYARLVRSRLKNFVSNAEKRNAAVCERRASAPSLLSVERLDAMVKSLFDAAGSFVLPLRPAPALKAEDFSATNPAHVAELKRMGIQLEAGDDGRVQLIHSAAAAESEDMARAGLRFMTDMVALAKQQETEVPHAPRMVQLLSRPYLGQAIFSASPAQFGEDLGGSRLGVHATAVVARPFRGCGPLENAAEVVGRIALLERSDCMFVEKVRAAEDAGAVAAVVIDHAAGTSAASSPLFAMSGDGGKTDVSIPAVFLFRAEGTAVLAALQEEPGLLLRIADGPLAPRTLFTQIFTDPEALEPESACPALEEEWAGATRYVHVFVNGKGETCVQNSDDDTAVCFAESEPLAPVDDGLISVGARRPAPIGPTPLEEPASEGSKDGGACRYTGDGSLECPALPARTESASDASVLLDTSTVQIVLGPGGLRHIKFKFGSFLVPEGDARGAALAIVATTLAETNIGALEPRFMATLERMALMAAGQHVQITAEDERNLGELGTLLKAKPSTAAVPSAATHLVPPDATPDSKVLDDSQQKLGSPERTDDAPPSTRP